MITAQRIARAVVRAVAQAARERRVVIFRIDGVSVAVCGDSNQSLIYRDIVLALAGKKSKRVGPYPDRLCGNVHINARPVEIAFEEYVRAQKSAQ